MVGRLLLFITGLSSVLIENYQASLGLDDSLIGNGFKALRRIYPRSMVCSQSTCYPTLAENNNNA
ncbi:hypothetical protein FFI16_009405 [Pseudomonas sp. KBS0710]|nr:hypothetical protein FFI16_009405 [Pseudomonas sp. KBS0710]